jgi:hypothetical protein
MGAQIPVPYALLPTAWTRQGQPQQELPNDDPVGINTFGQTGTAFDTIRRTVPFWAELVDTLDPGNAHFSAWDVVRMAGETLPGICAVTGKTGKRFDLKKSKGSQFSTITHQGKDPAEIRVVESIWTRQQLLALWRVLPVLQSATSSLKDGTIQACEVRHPALDLMGINAVVVRGVTIPHLTKDGKLELEFDLLEYNPRDKRDSTGTANGALYTTPTRTDESRVLLNPLTSAKPPFTDTGPNGARGR